MKVFLASLALLSAALPVAAQNAADPLHGWTSASTPAAFEAWIQQRIVAEKADLAKLQSVTGPRTVENTLRPYDDAVNELAVAGNNAYLLYSLADTAALRDKGQQMAAQIGSAQTDLGLDPQVYKALSAIATPADPATRHYLEHVLLEYHLAGVDRDEATRKKIHDLQDKITDLTLEFSRNIADGMGSFKAKPEELAGLPADFIAAHQPGADGLVTLTTDEPDHGPVMSFATSATLRRRMFLAYTGRAWPKNDAVLRRILVTRQQLADTLGYAHYADYATADQMIGTPANVTKLIDDLDKIARPAAAREYQQVLTLARQSQPGLQEISLSDSAYWREQFRRSHFNFDAQSVRPYFPYAQVQAGILTTAARLFHVRFTPVKNAALWDSSVDVFDVYDAADGAANRKLGRIYLDMHPRPGKDKWFSSSPVIPGIRGRQLPEGMLVCNFSGGKPGEPGLMQYDEVVTFFHEFGHLMHNILGSQGDWSAAGGFNVEGDFVESPSQMLEEFFHSATILQSFGHHYQTGEPVPAALIERMNAASSWGRGTWVEHQLLYSNYSLTLHNQRPDTLDFDATWAAMDKRYSAYAGIHGDHTFASFTHLTGYASNYYTYLLDKVIAIDFFAQFDQKNLLDGPTAMRYRRAVLEPGGSKPATQLVQDFLGRPQSMEAIGHWINQEPLTK